MKERAAQLSNRSGTRVTLCDCYEAAVSALIRRLEAGEAIVFGANPHGVARHVSLRFLPEVAEQIDSYAHRAHRSSFISTSARHYLEKDPT